MTKYNIPNSSLLKSLKSEASKAASLVTTKAKTELNKQASDIAVKAKAKIAEKKALLKKKIRRKEKTN